jgi:2-dehydro-3-deoxyphosphooctonate aldolase (KDO 8-P synthase)
MNEHNVAAKNVKVGNIKIGEDSLSLIAGPCVIESRKQCLEIASQLAEISMLLDTPLVFKASYDKANRSSHESFRGLGIKSGMEILLEVKETYGLPILTDVHTEQEIPIVSNVADVIQIPAFLSRQTDLVLAVGRSGRVVNIKKAQFMSPQDVFNVVKKVESTGNKNILLTERGTCFGYNQLVVDMRGIPAMQDTGYPVIFDATHSVQAPGGAGNASSGDSTMAPCLARAAVAAGCNGLFIETHTDPKNAKSDKDTMIPTKDIYGLWKQLKSIHDAVNGNNPI